VSDVRLPSLEGIEVRVPAPTQVQAVELMLVFQALQREQAGESPRLEGEKVQAGDEVLIDLVAITDVAIVPFSARAGLWLDASSEPQVPGLRASLAGVLVGERIIVPHSFGAAFPVAALRGRELHFDIDVVAARAVEIPDPADPALLQAIGRGATLDETMASIARQLAEERQELLRHLAEQLALGELTARAQIEVARDEIDAIIRARWIEAEGTLLAAKGFSDAAIELAFVAWLQDRDLRAEIEGGLRVQALLEALVEHWQLRLERGEVEAYLAGFAEGSELRVEELRASLDADPEARRGLTLTLLQHEARRRLMQMVKVELE